MKVTNQNNSSTEYNNMDAVHSHYQRACVVISGDILEDWKYIFRELKTRVSVSVQIFLPSENCVALCTS